MQAAPSKPLKLVSAGGVAAGVAALIASSCCALPLALGLMGASTAVVAMLDPLQAMRPAILVICGALLAAGWWMAIRNRSRRAYGYLALGSALFLIALAWSWWDPVLQRMMLSQGG